MGKEEKRGAGGLTEAANDQRDEVVGSFSKRLEDVYKCASEETDDEDHCCDERRLISI